MSRTMVTVAECAPKDVGRAEALELYEAVGWTTYTRDPDVLMRSLAGSHRLVAARDQGRLVGLARSLSDGATVVYLQDVLVHPRWQRSRLGGRLLAELFAGYHGVRQRVLLTDDEEHQRAFYEALGFVEAHDHVPPLRSFVRSD